MTSSTTKLPAPPAWLVNFCALYNFSPPVVGQGPPQQQQYWIATSSDATYMETHTGVSEVSIACGFGMSRDKFLEHFERWKLI